MLIHDIPLRNIVEPLINIFFLSLKGILLHCFRNNPTFLVLHLYYVNSQVQRPADPALISIIDTSSGYVMYQIPSTDRSVSFKGDTLIFIPSRDEIFNGTTADFVDVELKLEEGVAMPKSNGCGSAPAQWLIHVNGNEYS